ncbi:MAG: ABC transporter permease subunit [Propionibacteriales bacterium]|nr:ABC transporter permease subunit [Propionibacteriales bacterium]
MGRYLIRRLLQFIPVLLGALFLLHYMTVVGIQISGDPVRALFGDNPPPESVLAAMRADYGLDNPCLDRRFDPCVAMFVERLGQYATGDFGIDLRQGRPITEHLGERFPTTMRLALIAVVFETVLGIALGVLAGLRKDRFVDNLVRASTVLLIAFPVFIIGTLIQVYVGVKLGNWIRGQDSMPDWFGQMFTVTYSADYPWLSLILPGLVLGAFSLAAIARLTRTSVIENLRADYVRTAKAKGMPGTRVVGVHTLRNSLIPVVTYIGFDIGNLMAGAVVTEGIFGVPGIGQFVFQGTQNKDAGIVVGTVTILVLVYLIFNLVVDLLYAVLDPRIRYD